MSSVNHTSTVSGNTSDLVPESEMLQQQQDAAGETKTPIAAHVAPLSPAVKPQPSIFHKLELSVLVSLDLTKPYMIGRKKALSAVRASGDASPINLYSPFRAAAKEKEGKPAVLEGVVRSILNDMLDVTDEVNSARIMMLGKQNEIAVQLTKSVKDARSKFEALLPFQSDDVVMVGAVTSPEDTVEPLDVTFGNVVRIGSWVNSQIAATEDSAVLAQHNGVITVTVSSAIVYDSEEKFKAISQVESVLERLLEKREGGETQVLFSILLDPASLSDPDYRELLGTLIEVGGFELYTRRELESCKMADWLPTTKAEVSRELLVEGSELMLLKLIGGEEAAPEEGDATASADAE